MLRDPTPRRDAVELMVVSPSSEQTTPVAGTPHSVGGGVGLAWLLLVSLRGRDETSSVSVGKTANWTQCCRGNELALLAEEAKEESQTNKNRKLPGRSKSLLPPPTFHASSGAPIVRA